MELVLSKSQAAPDLGLADRPSYGSGNASAHESYHGNKIVARLRGMTWAIALALIFFLWTCSKNPAIQPKPHGMSYSALA
jgi:hypothetical protein